MIDTEKFTELVYGFWARRFEYVDADFNSDATYIYEDAELEGSTKAILYQIGALCVLRIGHDLLAKTSLQTAFPCAIKALDIDWMKDCLAGKYKVTLKSVLLDWFLNAEDHIPHPAPQGFNARQLDGVKDDTTLREFYAAASEEDLEEAEIYVDEPDPVIMGLFDQDGKMASYASHRYWEDLLCDIGVLVHPDQRSRGLGKAVVSALCDWCIAHEKIPMYRVFDYHTRSQSIPKALGFQMMARIESLEIKKE